MSTESRTPRRPTHRIYAVLRRPNDAFASTEVGAAWPHTDGKGFNLKLDYLPLRDGELLIREPQSDTPEKGSAHFATEPTASHRVYTVSRRGNDERSFWTEIGTAWPHSDGHGFQLTLDYLPLNGGELVIRQPRSDAEQVGEAA